VEQLLILRLILCIIALLATPILCVTIVDFVIMDMRLLKLHTWSE
jgi:hypothetical protein